MAFASPRLTARAFYVKSARLKSCAQILRSRQRFLLWGRTREALRRSPRLSRWLGASRCSAHLHILRAQGQCPDTFFPSTLKTPYSRLLMCSAWQDISARSRSAGVVLAEVAFAIASRSCCIDSTVPESEHRCTWGPQGRIAADRAASRLDRCQLLPLRIRQAEYNRRLHHTPPDGGFPGM